MKGAVFKDNYEMEVEEVPKPKIEDSRDAVIKVTSAAICGSDLHMYDGRTDMEHGNIFGHEIMGVIEEIGDSITSLKVGDRVVLPFNISCGFCLNCTKGLTSACLTTNPDGVGAAYGYADMGPYQGGQAEFVRVPFAEFNCLKLPGKPYDEYENDFLMLADIFPTGYHACELAHVSPGKTVAIFGAGPVGLLAAHSAIIKGASEVYVIDRSETRLKLAESIGATPINFEEGDPTEQIKKIRMNNKLIKESLRLGEEKALGVDCGIDAVGYQAKEFKDGKKEDPTSIIKQLVKLVNAGGHIGVIGVFPTEDPGATDKGAEKGLYNIPWGELFAKGLNVGFGQTPCKKYIPFLRDLIISGVAAPGVIVSHVMDLKQAPEGYEKFDHRGVGEGSNITKIVLRP